DKRLLAVETEFALVLRVLRREGNTLSALLRQAWDNGTLATLTRHAPLRATDAHVSAVGHITEEELGRYLDQTELFNGFANRCLGRRGRFTGSANRFLWLLVRRSKELPEGGRDLDLSPFAARLGRALAAAREVGAMSRDAGASRLWREAYPRLTAGRAGLYGA